jgi:preprotein translocase subunit SecF
LPLIVLVLFGPDVIFGFSLAMAFGIVVGTYSSVYQAAPILIWLKVGPHSFVPTEGVGPKAERIGEGFGAQP